jgi:hypothetical protein
MTGLMAKWMMRVGADPNNPTIQLSINPGANSLTVSA